MRWLFLLLVLTPGAHALAVTVDAPPAVVTDGTPVAAEVRVTEAEGPVEVRAWLGGEDWQASRTWNGTAFQRSDRYAFEVEPGDDGRWTGRVWVRANPDSSNAERLQATDRPAVGVRVRGDGGRAGDVDHARPLEGARTGWALAGPNRSIRVTDGEETVTRLGAPGQPRPIRVPEPDGEIVVCDREGCTGSFEGRLTRLGPDRAGLSVPTNASTAGGAVLAHVEKVCALGGDQGEGGDRWVRLDRLAERGRCVDASAREGLAGLWARGRQIAGVPERPGRGHVVWDPAREEWAPWRLPAGIQPDPIERLHVEGRAVAFGTQTQGLKVLEDSLSRARERVTASTYLLTSRDVAEALARPAQRGVDVHLYLEPDPVGGLPEETKRLTAWLEGQGVSVHEHEGPSDSGLQHAKVVVVDSGLVLVLTENMTDHGLPTRGDGNVGVGVGMANASLARRVEEVFRQPGDGREIRPDSWGPVSAPVSVVTAPENAWRTSGVPAWIDSRPGPIEGAVLRATPRWGPRENAWLAAMVEQSRDHGVEVLLSGAPEGAARSNREAVTHLEAHPDAGNLTARLADPRRGTVHAKVLAGPASVLVGSSNWGLGGVLLNREVNLLVEDRRLAEQVSEALEPRGEPERWGVPHRTPGPGWAPLAVVLALAARPVRRWVS